MPMMVVMGVRGHEIEVYHSAAGYIYRQTRKNNLLRRPAMTAEKPFDGADRMLWRELSAASSQPDVNLALWPAIMPAPLSVSRD